MFSYRAVFNTLSCSVFKMCVVCTMFISLKKSLTCNSKINGMIFDDATVYGGQLCSNMYVNEKKLKVLEIQEVVIPELFSYEWHLFAKICIVL